MDDDVAAAAGRVAEYLRGAGPEDPRDREICRQLVNRLVDNHGQDPERMLRQGQRAPAELATALERLAAGDRVVEVLIGQLGSSRYGAAAAGPAVVHHRVTTALGQGIAVGGNVVGDIHQGSREPAAAPTAAPASAPAPDRAQPAAPPPATPATSWSADAEPSSPDPDLELRVRLCPGEARPTLVLELTATGAANGEPWRSGPVVLQADPAAYVANLFEPGQRLNRSSDRETDLRAAGAHLCHQLVPRDLADLLMKLRHRFKTLLVRSDEPWLPWELLALPDGRSGIFMCEAFDLTRWPARRPPPVDLPLERMAVVSAGGDDPIAVDREVAALRALRGKRRVVSQVPARLRELVGAMARAEHDGWHFCGHGMVASGDADQAAVALDDYGLLTPRHLSGEAAALGRARPLVFFNGCSTGRTGFSLTSAGGWAHAFVDAGAGAFLGAFWAISGDPAADFAQAFYDNFLAGVPLGAAVRSARQQLGMSRPDDVTRFAYTVYGHPLASAGGADP